MAMLGEIIILLAIILVMVLIFLLRYRHAGNAVDEIDRLLSQKQYDRVLKEGATLLDHDLSPCTESLVKTIMATAVFRLRDYKAAEEMTEDACSIINDDDCPDIAARAHFWYGRSLAKNDYLDEAMQQYEIALKLAKAEHLDSLALSIANSHAASLLQTGRTSEARDLILDVLEYASHGSDFAYSLCYNTLGVLEHALGNNDDAIRYYNHSLQYLKDDLIGISIAYNNIANIFLEMGEIEKALVHYQKALEVSQQANDDEGIAFVMRNIAELLASKGEFDRAANYYQQARDYFTRIEIPPVEPILGLCRMMTKLNRIDDAQELLTELDNYTSDIEQNFVWHVRYELTRIEIAIALYKYDNAATQIQHLLEDSRISSLMADHLYLLLLSTEISLKKDKVDTAFSTLLSIEQKAREMENVMLIWQINLLIALVDILEHRFDEAEERIKQVLTESHEKNYAISEKAELLLARSQRTRDALTGYDVADKVSESEEDLQISKEEVSDYISSVKEFVSQLTLVS